jgi:hypothetical protein
VSYRYVTGLATQGLADRRSSARSSRGAEMDPDSALSAGALMAIAFTVAVAMAIWLGAVYYAARQPGNRKSKAKR